jgi:hypothetical protein
MILGVIQSLVKPIHTCFPLQDWNSFPLLKQGHWTSATSFSCYFQRRPSIRCWFLHNLLMTSKTWIQMTFGVTNGGLHFPPDVHIFILLVLDRCLKLSNGCGKHQCKNDIKYSSGCYLRIGWAQETFFGAEIKSYRHMSVFSAIYMLRKHWSIFFYTAILREATGHL